MDDDHPQPLSLMIKGPLGKRKIPGDPGTSYAQPTENTPPELVLKEGTKKGKKVKKTKKTKKERIEALLIKMGADPPEDTTTSKGGCVRAAIYRGHIKITGDPAELDMIVHKEEGTCGHMIEAKLRDLLEQDDMPGPESMEEAAVFCQENYDQLIDGKVEPCCTSVWVSNICKGRPSFDNHGGKLFQHCHRCSPGAFGKCIGDYRNEHCIRCNVHFWAGSGNPCPRCNDGNGFSSDNSDSNLSDDEFKGFY